MCVACVTEVGVNMRVRKKAMILLLAYYDSCVLVLVQGASLAMELDICQYQDLVYFAAETYEC